MEIFKIFACISIFGTIVFGLQVWSVRSAMKNRIKDTGHIINGKRNQTSNVFHPGQYYPPISILKPLKGLVGNLFENLESFCIQDYPHYEIIFSLQDHNDPAYKVAMKIKEKYPDRDITVLVKRCDAGLNPKVNNLMPAYAIARFEYILISDSDGFVDMYYLKEISKYMEDPQVGLVSNIYWGVGGRGVGCIFDNIHLNSFVIGGVCFLDRFFKEPWTFGGSMLMRKSDMESIGGLTAVKDVLAEDVIIRNKMKKMGKKIILSSYIIKKVNEDRGIREFLNRLTRWGQIRWRIGGLRYFSELFTNSVFMAYLPIFIWEPSKLTISFAMAVSSLKVIGNIYLDSLVRGERADRTLSREPRIVQFSPLWYLLSPLNDFIMGIIWFVPLFSNTVMWRGNSYRISKDSALSQHNKSRTGLKI
ncbi:MAG: glycosyltransferase [Thermodesulfovibrionales bacterium]